MSIIKDNQNLYENDLVLTVDELATQLKISKPKAYELVHSKGWIGYACLDRFFKVIYNE